jgi:hypothetical protein
VAGSEVVVAVPSEGVLRKVEEEEVEDSGSKPMLRGGGTRHLTSQRYLLVEVYGDSIRVSMLDLVSVEGEKARLEKKGNCRKLEK